MKYSILINQLAWLHYYPEARAQHAIIFDSIKSICNSASSKIIRTSDGYTYISSKLILDENPILHLTSKGSVTKIIQELKDWKLIDYQTIEQKNYYRLTEESEKLDRSKNDDLFKILNSTVQNIEQEPFNKMNRSYNKDQSNYNNPINNISPSGSNQKSRAEINAEWFETVFWPAYPARKGIKQGKKKAKQWVIKNLNGDANFIMTGVNNYSKSEVVLKGFAMDAYRFLLNAEFEAWQKPETVNQSKGNNQHAGNANNGRGGFNYYDSDHSISPEELAKLKAKTIKL